MTPWDLPEKIRSRIRVDEFGCWIWTGRRKSTGYGLYHFARRPMHAHRAVYLTVGGEIPDGLEIDHLCRIRPCVNPEHLEVVTRAQNMRRRVMAQTHCIHGHEFTPENTYFYSRGNAMQRCCKTCTLRRLNRQPA